MRAQVAVHPNAYEGLLGWLNDLGDPAVSAAVASRSPQVAESGPARAARAADPATETPAPDDPVNAAHAAPAQHAAPDEIPVAAHIEQSEPTAESPAIQPHAPQPQVPQPQVPQPQVPQPQVSQPQVSQPAVPLPEVSQPEVPQPDIHRVLDDLPMNIFREPAAPHVAAPVVEQPEVYPEQPMAPTPIEPSAVPGDGLAAPVYTMIPMPDGTQQMMPMMEPVEPALRSKNGNGVGVVALIAGIVSVAALVVSQVISPTAECTTFEISCPGMGIAKILTWGSLLFGLVGVICGIVGIVMYRRRNATNLAASIIGLCLGSIILVLVALALFVIGAFL